MKNFRIGCGHVSAWCLDSAVDVIHHVYSAMTDSNPSSIGAGLLAFVVAPIVTLPVTLPLFVVGSPLFYVAGNRIMRDIERQNYTKTNQG